MKNKYLILLFTASLSFSSWSLATVAKLQVAGNIKPPTCIINDGSEGLLYDFGSQAPSLIPEDKEFILPSIANSLTISCDAQTYLTFRATDTYSNVTTVIPTSLSIHAALVIFNLVNAENTAQQVGGVSFLWSDVTVDGLPAYLSRANDSSNNTDYNATTALQKDVTVGWTRTQQENIPPRELSLIAGKVFSTTLTTRITGRRSYILPKRTLITHGIDTSNIIDYIGQVILTFKFGI